MVHRGQKLEDGNNLSHYNIAENSTIWIIKKTKEEIEKMVESRFEQCQEQMKSFQSLNNQYLKMFSGNLLLHFSSLFHHRFSHITLLLLGPPKEASAAPSASNEIGSSNGNSSSTLVQSFNRILIQNLPLDITEQKLYDRFGGFGTIMVNKVTGRPSIWMSRNGLGNNFSSGELQQIL